MSAGEWSRLGFSDGIGVGRRRDIQVRSDRTAEKATVRAVFADASHGSCFLSKGVQSWWQRRAWWGARQVGGWG